MTRDAMLKKFESLEYMTIEPGHWEDVGFTERPICGRPKEASRLFFILVL